MFTQVIATKEAATTKWWARQDAAERNARNIGLYTERQRARAAEVHVRCQLVYRARGFYISYGTLGISIKVDRAQIADYAAVARLEADLHAQGVHKKHSAQGVIYRIAF